VLGSSVALTGRVYFDCRTGDRRDPDNDHRLAAIVAPRFAPVIIDRDRLDQLREREERRFVELHPRSAVLAEQAQASLLAGVPMPWMTRWPGSFPVFVDTATGARFTDVDGIEYVDLCLGDTGAMTGHALPQVTEAVSRRASTGVTTMLPSEDAIWVAGELGRRFGLPRWQFAMSATDANRFVLRFARRLTGRPRIAVMDWCYHGTVDETLAVLDGDQVVHRPGAMGPQVDVALTTAVVPFNDLEALDRRLAQGDVACLLMEPALTNIGIVLPVDGYSEGVREITRKHDVLLVIDETHTLCAGPGGCTAAWGLEPDLLVVGKPIAGGVPLAAYGMTAEIADRLTGPMLEHEADVSGVGGTLTANALALAASRAALSSALREEDYAVAIPLAGRFAAGVQGVIERHGLPWHVQQLGCRAEYWFCPPPRDGAAAAAAVDDALEQLMHLWALNRGVLLTPFHNMALFSPSHSEADVDRHTEVFGEAVSALLG
jgi:glutamate-1-semialdehyde 2,1-aminomutase